MTNANLGESGNNLLNTQNKPFIHNPLNSSKTPFYEKTEEARHIFQKWVAPLIFGEYHLESVFRPPA